ncbi:long-chain-fatty-acid--CoA ligase [Myxococcota bacterium]|nr:long-chain-fatty-acid--CoA ligase [Myxococcota bacterium]
MIDNIGLFIAKRAHLNSKREALVEVERGRRFDFSQLDARTNRAAHAMLNQGVTQGDRVALLMMNGVEYVESFFGLAKIGAVVVPLNWRLLADELEFILKDSESSVLIYDAEFDQVVAQLAERELGIDHFIRVGDASELPTFASDYDAITSAASSESPKIEACGDDLLFIMYTSGTTGRPKGAMHSHASMLAASTAIVTTADVRRGDRYLQMLPLFHVGALTPTISTFHSGSTLVLMRAFDPSRAWEILELEQVTTGLAVPAMLQFMWVSPLRESSDTATLRWLMCGAAPVPVPLIEHYDSIGIEIHQVYGLTETGGPACLIGSEEALAKAGSTGAPFFHTEVRVVRPDGSDTDPGEVGEVLVRGRHLMLGYWNRAEATAESIRDGWLYTGDLASIDEDGFVYIRDRIKDMIISGGENIYPAEIESVLAGHPSLKESAVIGIPSERWGESPAAIVVLRDEESASAEELIEYCRDKLAPFKVPRVVEFLSEIPRNPTGKILKRVLREQFPGPSPE